MFCTVHMNIFQRIYPQHTDQQNCVGVKPAVEFCPINETQSFETQAGDIQPNDIVLETAYGEPSGAILDGRNKTEIGQWVVHDAWVKAWRIGGDPG